MVIKLLLVFREKIIPNAVWVTRSRSNYISIVRSIFYEPIINKLGTVVATREWIIYCIYANPLNFTPWGIYVSQTFLVVFCFTSRSRICHSYNSIDIVGNPRSVDQPWVYDDGILIAARVDTY